MSDRWTSTTLGDIAELTIGRTPPRKDPQYWTSDLSRPFCTIADMDRRQVNPSREGVTKLAESEGKAKRVPAGSLIMSFKLTIGRVGFADVDLFPNEAIVHIKAKEGSCDERYLALWLESQDLTAQSGRAVKGNTLNSASLRAIRVQLPPLPVQRRIVDLMEHLDTHIRNLDVEQSHCVEALRLRRDVLMRAENTGQAADVFDILMGRQRSPSRSLGPNMTPYLRAANVKDGYLVIDSDVKEMDFTPEEQRRYAVAIGDVMVSEGSGSHDAVGACAAVTRLPSPTTCFQNTLLRYRAVSGKSISDFVHHWCRWAFESGAFRDVATGTNILHIGSRRAAAMLVPALDTEQQGRVVTELNAWQGTCDSLDLEVRRLRKVRAQLLSALLRQDAMTVIPQSYDGLVAVTS